MGLGPRGYARQFRLPVLDPVDISHIDIILELEGDHHLCKYILDKSNDLRVLPDISGFYTNPELRGHV